MAIGATAIWRVRPSGSNSNGGGYDPGIAGAATDYSQQNAAQATGTVGTASGTATFTDAGAAFTSAMVGNALWIASGAGFTVGAYFIITFNSTTSVVLDRSPGTGTVAHWALGGGWADFWTNPNLASFPVNPGNTVFLLGAGTPNPASYSFDYTMGANIVTGFNGSATAGMITFANDPSTPGYKAPPDTTGGMPLISMTPGTNGNSFSAEFIKLVGLWVTNNSTSAHLLSNPTNSDCLIFGCVYDQVGIGNGVTDGSGSTIDVLGCEIFSSVPVAPAGAFALDLPAGSTAAFNNIHDTTNPGVKLRPSSAFFTSNIVAKCGGDAITAFGNVNAIVTISNNTIDGNNGNGIILGNQTTLQASLVFSNIISNHTGVSVAGISVSAGTQAANDLVKQLVDYNSFYNNTANYSAISAGPHDTALGVTPYNVSATEDYKLI